MWEVVISYSINTKNPSYTYLFMWLGVSKCLFSISKVV